MTCVILLLPQGSVKMEEGRGNGESGGSKMKNKRPWEMPLFLTLKMSKMEQKPRNMSGPPKPERKGHRFHLVPWLWWMNVSIRLWNYLWLIWYCLHLRTLSVWQFVTAAMIHNRWPLALLGGCCCKYFQVLLTLWPFVFWWHHLPHRRFR